MQHAAPACAVNRVQARAGLRYVGVTCWLWLLDQAKLGPCANERGEACQIVPLRAEGRFGGDRFRPSTNRPKRLLSVDRHSGWTLLFRRPILPDEAGARGHRAAIHHNCKISQAPSAQSFRATTICMKQPTGPVHMQAEQDASPTFSTWWQP